MKPIRQKTKGWTSKQENEDFEDGERKRRKHLSQNCQRKVLRTEIDGNTTNKISYKLSLKMILELIHIITIQNIS